MSTPVRGLHYVTACGGGAEQGIDFFTQVVGERLIKQTILFDGRYAHYHLCYANAEAEPGQQKALYDELGYTDCSEIKDRNYFHSICCRCSGSILVECAATVPGRFGKDEAFSQLATHLLLPPWFGERRAEIEAMLEPIRGPERHTLVPAAGTSGPSRRKPVFGLPKDEPVTAGQ